VNEHGIVASLSEAVKTPNRRQQVPLAAVLGSAETCVAGAMTDEGEDYMPSLGDIRESLALAESLASASLLASPGAKRRLASRRLEMNEDPSTGAYTPPKHLLLYLVR
jgi:hypothetical protein